MNWSLRYATRKMPAKCLFCGGVNHLIHSAAREWDGETAIQTGLPRPSVSTKPLSNPTGENAQKNWRQRVIIPWNSSPLFEGDERDTPNGLNGAPSPIPDREEQVQTKNKCAMCGEQFNKKDNAVRFNGQHNQVVSDHYPMHEKCMDMTTRFCPHMMEYAKDFRAGIGPFERGTYDELRKNADNQSRSMSYQFDKTNVVSDLITRLRNRLK